MKFARHFAMGLMLMLLCCETGNVDAQTKSATANFNFQPNISPVISGTSLTISADQHWIGNGISAHHHEFGGSLQHLDAGLVKHGQWQRNSHD